MSPVRPAPHGSDGPWTRPAQFGSPSSPARPQARTQPGPAGRLRIMLYRHRWLRWAAAAAAALTVLATLRNDSSDPAPGPTAAAPPGPAVLLPSGSRGVPVPVDSTVFAVHDSVDVHSVLDGAAVARGALIVDTGDGEVVVAVPAERVDATVDALATGGVVLVLVPQPEIAPP